MAAQSRTFSFVISGSSEQAVQALRKLAEAGKNTGGELGKAGKALDKALTATPTVARGSGAAAGKSWSDAFALGAKQNLGAKLDSLLPSGLGSDLFGSLGGGEAAVGGLSTKAAVAAAGLTAAAVAAAGFGKAAVSSFVDAAGAASEFQRQTGASADAAFKLTDTADLLGVSQQSLQTTFGKFAVAINTNMAGLNEFGFVAKRTADGNLDLSESFLSAVDAFQRIPDAGDRAEFAAAAFGRSWKDLLPILSKSRTEIEALYEKAFNPGQKGIDDVREFKKAWAELKDTASDAMAAFGADILPVITDVIEQFGTAVDKVGEFKDAVGSLGGTQEVDSGPWASIIAATKTMIELRLEGLGLRSKEKGATDSVADSSVRSADALERQAEAAKVNTFWLSDYGDAADDAAKKTYDLSDAALSAADKLGLASSEFAKATSDDRTAIRLKADLAGAYADLDEAVAASTVTSTKAADAAVDLASTQMDAARDVARARQDAAEQIADVEVRSGEQIVSAQRRVQDAREQATRALEDAQSRVEDAQQALVDAAVHGGDTNPFEALRSMEDARKRLSEAERDQSRAQVDAAANVADAETELADAVSQAAKDRAKVQADAAEKIAAAEESAAKRVESAQKAVQDATAESTRKAQDYTGALQGLVDKSFDAAYWAREHGASEAEVQAIVDTSRQKVESYAAALGLGADETARLIAQLALIPPTVELNFVMRMNLDEFNAALKTASEAFSDPLAREMVASGAALNEGGVSIIPRFAGGGMFRTSVAGGAGLAVLHDGERVLTPEQQTAGGVTLNVYGTVVAERELADMLARLNRQGYTP